MIYKEEELKGKLNQLNIQKFRDEFESLINDDEEFREMWALTDRDYNERDFYDWFQDVIYSSSFEDIIQECNRK